MDLNLLSLCHKGLAMEKPFIGHQSVPKRHNGLSLIFGKIELGAFSESLRPPQSIAGSIMTLAGL